MKLKGRLTFWRDGGRVVQETRLYDSEKNETRSMRSKEVANDYRYFPEPDLLPIIIDQAYIEEIRTTLPELPDAKRQRFIDQYKLSEYDALVLANDLTTASYFEDVVAVCGNAKLSANWVSVDLQAYLNEAEIPISESPVTPELLGGLINKITDNTISSKIAKTVFEAMLAGEGDAEKIIKTKGLKQVTDSGAIEAMVEAVIANNPEQVEQYRSGKEKVFGFFVGQIMKDSKGKANPTQVNQILKDKLSN